MQKLVKILASFVLLVSMVGLANTQVASAAASFIKPNDGPYTSYYGWRDLDGNPSNGKEDFHNGIDIAPGSSLSVKASASGEVTRVAYMTNGFGNYVILRHTVNGKLYDTLYAHLASTNVSVGQTVSQGSQIGIMGNTGASEGTHLHFQMHPNGYEGDKNSVDPYPYINGDIEEAPPAPTPIPHTYDGSWATLRTVSTTGNSTVNTYAHAGYGLNGTLPTGSLYKVYEKKAYNGVDYFSVASSKWVHRNNSEVKPYVATAKYTSPTLDTPGGTKIDSLSPGDSYKTYEATTLSDGTTWYSLGSKGWVRASFVDVVRVP